MAHSYEAFAVCGADYSDPAIIAINSFCKFNPGLRLRVYVEAGTNISRLRGAVGHYRAEFRETEFPELPEHEGMGDSLSGLFYRPAALPSFAQRIRGLEELRQETPIEKNGTPEDVAKAFAYLAEADFVTGQVLSVNGGYII